MTLWPHWLRPGWLLLLPLLVWMLWHLWRRERRSGRWQSLLPPAFHAVLLENARTRNNRLPRLALGAAWLLALLALLGPSWQHLEQPGLKRADPLVVILQLTPQMLAADVASNRLDQARHKLIDLLEARQEAQTAIVVYAGSAHTVVPLSDDMDTTRNLLDALKPSIMPVAGQRADLAVARGLQLLEHGGQGSGRLLLVTCGLSERERDGIRDALRGHGAKLGILGIGSPQGAPVPLEQGGFLKDEQGAIVFSRLDFAALQRTAADAGGLYAQARLDDGDLRALQLLGRPEALRQDGEATLFDRWTDQGHWLLLPLLLIAACAGRRGWLFCLPLLFVLLPRPGYAFELEDLWLRPDQQGQRLLERQRPAEAATRFKDPRWQGEALYQAGDYAGAAQRFTLGNGAADHYNRGNALAKGGELEAAIEAYDTALALQPGLLPAQKNKALVEEALRQRRERQAQGQQGQQAQDQASSAPSDNDESASGEPAGTPPPAMSDGGQSAPRDPRQADATPIPDETGENAAPHPSGKAAGGVQASPEQPPPGGEARTDAPDAALDPERRQSLEQWLRQIPDDPSELLRRKFWYEQQQEPRP